MRRCEVCNVLENQVNHLRELLDWYRKENRSLLNRVLITAKVPPIVEDEDKVEEQPPQEEQEQEEEGETYGG